MPVLKVEIIQKTRKSVGRLDKLSEAVDSSVKKHNIDKMPDVDIREMIFDVFEKEKVHQKKLDLEKMFKSFMQ